MATRRGASVGAIVMALAGLGAVGAAGWAVMTGTTPCDIIGACSIGSSSAGNAGGATLPVSASAGEAHATPSCCELAALAEQGTPEIEPGAGEVIPASVERAVEDAATEACAGSCCAPKVDEEKPVEEAAADSCCAGGGHE